MTTTKLDRVGSWTALLIGLPIGLTFSFAVLFISLFPPIDLGLAAIGGGLFWHPAIFAVLIPLTFTFLLWTGGKRIKKHIDKNYSVIKISFLFIMFINKWLFGIMIPIFIAGELIIGTFSFFSFGIALGLTTVTFIILSIITIFTVGLLIVTITKSIINKRQ